MNKLFLSAAFAVSAMAFTGDAKAYLNCPSGQEEYNGQCWAPVGTQPEQPPVNVTANGGKSSSTSGAVAGANAGATVGDVGGGTATIGDVAGGNGGNGGNGGHGGAGGTATTGPVNVTNGPTTSGVRGSGNSRNDNRANAQQGQQQGQTQQARASNDINIDNSNRTRQAANSIFLGSAYAGEDRCKIGLSAGASTVGAQAGGGLNVIDKSCAVVRQMMEERLSICSMFGPNSGECASATYHTSAIGAMAMVESGRVREKSGPRVGVAPAKDRPASPTLVNAWNRGEANRAKRGIDTCTLNPSKC